MPSPLETQLTELVAIDSTSTRSNVPVIEYLERRLSALGLATQRVEYRDETGVEKANLLCAIGSGLPELALVGHTDCVPFDAGWTDALRLTEREGKLCGRGACDTKAFVASMLQVAERARNALNKPLLLAFTADEELGCLGAKKLVDAGLGRCRRAIIGEPTSLRPIRANKGYCLAEVEVHGTEAHSAYPDLGASAITRAARLISSIDAYARGPLRAQQLATFAPPFATVNIGMISGGKAKNIIAGSCRFTLEWRPLPGQPVDHLLHHVKRLRDELALTDAGFRATLTVLRVDHGFDTPESADLVQHLASASGNAPGTVSFGTEGPQLTALGAQPVVFGPGDIGVAHTSAEFVPKEELHRCAELLTGAVLHFCGSC